MLEIQTWILPPVNIRINTTARNTWKSTLYQRALTSANKWKVMLLKTSSLGILTHLLRHGIVEMFSYSLTSNPYICKQQHFGALLHQDLIQHPQVLINSRSLSTGIQQTNHGIHSLPFSFPPLSPPAFFSFQGYGNTYPVTRAGKYLCMLYALFGIPLMFLVLTDMGDILATVLSKSYNEFRKLQSKILTSKFCSAFTCIREDGSKVDVNEPLSIVEMLRSQSAVRKKPAPYRNAQIFEMLIARENKYKNLSRSKSIERWSSCPELDRGKTMTRVIENFDKIGKELEKLDVPIVLMVLVIFVYISCAAAILPNWETRLDFQEAFYFCFITLTTIGFGDTQLEHPKFFLFFSLYIIIGMEIVFIAFKLGQDRLIGLYKKVISFCGEKKVPSKKIYPK